MTRRPRWEPPSSVVGPIPLDCGDCVLGRHHHCDGFLESRRDASGNWITKAVPGGTGNSMAYSAAPKIPCRCAEQQHREAR